MPGKKQKLMLRLKQKVKRMLECFVEGHEFEFLYATDQFSPPGDIYKCNNCEKLIYY